MDPGSISIILVVNKKKLKQQAKDYKEEFMFLTLNRTFQSFVWGSAIHHQNSKPFILKFVLMLAALFTHMFLYWLFGMYQL
jgi:hypothetical protein